MVAAGLASAHACLALLQRCFELTGSLCVQRCLAGAADFV